MCCTGRLITAIILLSVINSTALGAPVYYVNSNAAISGNGLSWDSAFTDLQDALNAAGSGPAQIWVATGTYYPSVKVGGTSDRHKTFQLKNDVGIYGGFLPGGAWSERNPAEYATVLSGDIGSEGEPEDNCYHVFYHTSGVNLDDTAVLDGFTITRGNADDPNDANDSYFGGGMFNDGCSPTVVNCMFLENTAADGGGMYNRNNSNPEMTSCTFSQNSSIRGGGMFNDASSPLVTGCEISSNSASLEGGGMYNFYSSLKLIHTVIINNSALRGGGMYNYFNVASTLNSCTFANNQASFIDGVWIFKGDVFVDGTIQVQSNAFYGHDIKLQGGGVINIDSDAVLNLHNSRILCDLSGTGSVQVNLGSQLTIESNAIVNMAHANPVTDPSLNGTIFGEGLLRAKDNVQLMNKFNF